MTQTVNIIIQLRQVVRSAVNCLYGPGSNITFIWAKSHDQRRPRFHGHQATERESLEDDDLDDGEAKISCSCVCVILLGLVVGNTWPRQAACLQLPASRGE